MYAKTIKWGIIGCGSVTEIKSGPGLRKANNSELVAVMRRNGEMAKDYADRHNVAKWYDNAHQLINDPDVNAIYVATPPDSHSNYAIDALKAGKAVYVEKPMARTAKECQAMIQAQNETKTPLFVAYYRRSLGLFQKVKQLIEDGEIGNPISVNIRFFRPPVACDLIPDKLPWRVKPEIAGGGYFVDLASHQFDILNHLFGDILEVEGCAMNFAKLYPAEDTVTAHWQHRSGVMGAGSWCFVAGQTANKDHIEVVGTKGRIEFSTFKFSPVILKNDDCEREYYFEKPEHVEQPFIQSIVNELTEGTPSPASLDSALNTTVVMEKILHNYYKK